MTSNYHEAWDAMNKLQEHSSKLNTIKDLIDTAIKYNSDENTVSLLEATGNMIELYVEEFDDLYRAAWDKTIASIHKEQSSRFVDALDNIDTTNDGVLLSQDKAIKEKLQNSKKPLSCDKDDPSPECKGAWNDFWDQVDDEVKQSIQQDGYEWTPLPPKQDKVVKWRLPVQQSGEDYYVEFPDDLLEAANLKEGDKVEWVEQPGGAYLLRKV